MRACWLKWVGRDWSISADYIWLNYSGANNVSAYTRLSKSSIPSNTARNESIYRPDQSVELELLGAYGNENHATVSLVHATDKAGIRVNG